MNAHKQKTGFTLPEVVVTAVIVLLLMVPISRIAYSTLTSTRYARDVGSAISAGQQQLEIFSNMPYGDIDDGDTTIGKFILDWEVTTQQNAKIVRMTIEWTMASRDMEISLNAIYAAEGSGGFNLDI